MSAPAGIAAPGAVIEFADGLPGFEHQRQFVIISGPAVEPFTILRGLGPNAPSFAAIDPGRVVDGYAPAIAGADLARLRASDSTPLLWLAIVGADESGTAVVNLRAPIVVNPASLRGVQLIDVNQTGTGGLAYRFDHPLRAA